MMYIQMGKENIQHMRRLQNIIILIENLSIIFDDTLGIKACCYRSQ
jgi:hypothetical protein